MAVPRSWQLAGQICCKIPWVLSPTYSTQVAGALILRVVVMTFCQKSMTGRLTDDGHSNCGREKLTNTGHMQISSLLLVQLQPVVLAIRAQAAQCSNVRPREGAGAGGSLTQ